MLFLEAVGVACLCALAWYIFKNTGCNPMRRIPGPWGFPIIGNVLNIDWPVLHLQLSAWQSKYGPVMRVSLMGDDIVVISGAEAAKEALVSRGNDFAGRPPMWRAEKLASFKGIGTGKFTPGLVEKKKVMLHHLKAAHSEGFDGLERIVLDEMVDFLDRIASHKKNPVDARLETAACVCNIVATMVYGERYPYDHPAVKDIMLMNQKVLENAAITSPGKELDVFPWLRFTGLCTQGMRNLRTLETLRDAILTKKVKEERATFDPSSPRGIIDDLITRSFEGSDAKTQVIWSDDQIVSYLVDFFVGGISTTVNTMQSAYLILLKHPDLQNKLQNEIDKIIGDSEPSIKHRSKMPYTEAFIFELLRYSTMLPIMVPHMTIRDTSVGGYVVPANTRVLFNIWDIHHDNKVYPQPFDFRPERFLDEQGKLHDHDHPSRAHFLAFGAGRRSCPGEKFALARIFLLLVSLLQRFTLEADRSRPAPNPDPRVYRFSTMLDAPECFLVAVPRK